MWPLASHFSTMLQNPKLAFKDVELKTIGVETDSNRQPRAWSGAFATVYKASFPNGRGQVAIRVFTSAAAERRERYQAIAAWLKGRKIDPLVGFEYYDIGIRSASDGKYYPLVTMEWVPGETLFKWVGRQCADKNKPALARAADDWVELVNGLAAAQIAHGDLQHANVMVTPQGRLKLVDYDCMCVPALVGRTNLEIGVDPYQHPGRDHETRLSLALDHFSALFILVGLRALAAAPELWTRFVEQTQYDKLLIRHEDFDEPARSPLFQAMRRSSDGEVPRLLDELLKWREAPIDRMPALSEVLFSFEQVKALLDARDFDAAVELLARSKKPLTAAPPALQPRLRDAQARVTRRQELERAIDSGDERSMARLYDARLLDNYSRAKGAVAIAKLAPKVVPVLEQLRQARQAESWRQLVQVWDAHRALLNGRRSAAEFEADVKSWRQRNVLCDTLLAMLAQPDGDATALEHAWQQLAALGGHPDAAPRQAEVERRIKRDGAWHAFEKVSHAASFDADTALVHAWREDLFAGWPRAERERKRVEIARRRRENVRNLEAEANQPLSAANEERLVKLAADLPADYDHAMRPRVQLAHDRLHALAKFARARAAKPLSDLSLAAAWEKLVQSQAQALVPAADRATAATAVERAAVVHILKQLPTDYPIDRAAQLDARLLQTWNDALLTGCHDADAWREAWQRASRRRQVLDELHAAVTANNKLRIADLAADACLEGYPLPAEWARAAKSAMAEMQTFRHLLHAVQGNRPADFREAFDARVLRKHAQEFALSHERLRQWITAEVLPAEKLGLSPPLARKGLAREPGSNEAYRVCWRWPEPRYCEQCFLAVCRQAPRRGDDPRKLATLIRMPVDRKSYEEGGGSRRIHIDPAWSGGYVAVWAMVDAGFETFASEPLVLGRLEAIAKPTRRLGRFFG
jgi:hypothetical protein